MPNKQCSTCKFFKHESATGEGICEAPLPMWLDDMSTVVTCDYGSDCNAYQGKEERENNEAIQD
jgi:hypothetical protein